MNWVHAAILLSVGNFVAWMVAIYVKDAASGLVGHVVVSILGAFVGGYLSLSLAPDHGVLGMMIAAFIGSPLLLYVVRFKKRRRI